jgi:hypothetical protein
MAIQWDLKNTAHTLANNSLTLLGTSSGWTISLAGNARSTGKLYCEIKIDVAGSTNIMTGIVTGTPGTYPGNTASSWGYYSSGGEKYNNNASGAYGATYTSSDVIGIAVDFDNKKLYFAKNGVWQNSGDPVAGTGYAYNTIYGPAKIAISLYTATDKITARFRPGSFSYIPPLGFLPWDNSNTETPLMHWTMDRVSGVYVLNEIPGGCPLTLTGTRSIASNGKFGYYLVGGTTGNNSSLNSNTVFKSISMWIRRLNITNTSVILTNSVNNKLLAIQTSGSGNYIYYYSAGPHNSNLTITDTNWHHVCLVEATNTSTHYVWLDGVRSSGTVQSDTLGVAQHFGRSDFAAGQENVDFDNVQWYDYKLTDVEVAYLYNATSQTQTLPIPGVATSFRERLAQDNTWYNASYTNAGWGMSTTAGYIGYGSAGAKPSMYIREARLSKSIRSDEWLKLTNLSVNNKALSIIKNDRISKKISFSVTNPGISSDQYNVPVFLNIDSESGINKFSMSSMLTEIHDSDPDSNTVFLLQSKNKHGDTTFYDTSIRRHPISFPNGAVTHSKAQTKFNNSAIYLDGTSTYMTVDNSADFDLAANNFTIDFWFLNTGTTARKCLLTIGSSSYSSIRIETYNGNVILNASSSASSDTDLINSSVIGTVSTSFSHYAVSRSGNSWHLFKDGTLNSTLTVSGTLYFTSTYKLWIGYHASSNVANGYLSELRISNGIARWSSTFTPPTAPYYVKNKYFDRMKVVDKETKSILNTEIAGYSEGPDQHTVLLLRSNQVSIEYYFVDEARIHTFVINGSPTHSLTYPRIGSSSIYFNSDNSDYLSVVDNPMFDFKYTNFTIDFCFKRTRTATNEILCGKGNGSSGGISFKIEIVSDTIHAYFNTTDVNTGISVANSNWHHLAMVRSGGSVFFFLDGSLGYTYNIGATTAIITTTQNVVIANQKTSADNTFKGYIQEFRISRIARWTTAFTPSTSFYTISKKLRLWTRIPRIAATSTSSGVVIYYDKYRPKNRIGEEYNLLIQSNTTNGNIYFKDESTNDRTITPSNAAIIHSTSVTPVAGSSSVYFPGSYYMTVMNTANTSVFCDGNGDFTVALWIYTLQSDVYQRLISAYDHNTTNGFLLGIQNTNVVQFTLSSTSIASTTTISVNTWHHIAAVKCNGVLRLFINGIQENFTAHTTPVDVIAQNVGIGTIISQGTYTFKGYMNNIAIVRNKALWDYNFTPPTTQIQSYIGYTGELPAQRIWDSNYIAVYHMSQNPDTISSGILDSTINSLHGTAYNISSVNSNKVSLFLNGTTQGVSAIPYHSGFNTGRCTVSAIVNRQNPTGTATVFHSGDTVVSGSEGVVYSIKNSNISLAYRDVGLTTWYYPVTSESITIISSVVYQCNVDLFLQAYINGTLCTPVSLTQTISSVPATYGCCIGMQWDGGTTYSNFYSGPISEVRFSNVYRSNDWIKLMYLSDNDNLFTIS